MKFVRGENQRRNDRAGVSTGNILNGGRYGDGCEKKFDCYWIHFHSPAFGTEISFTRRNNTWHIPAASQQHSSSETRQYRTWFQRFNGKEGFQSHFHSQQLQLALLRIASHVFGKYVPHLDTHPKRSQMRGSRQLYRRQGAASHNIRETLPKYAKERKQAVTPNPAMLYLLKGNGLTHSLHSTFLLHNYCSSTKLL